MTGSSVPAREASTSLNRAIAILKVLGTAEGARDGVGVVRIARLIDREKSQVSRTLKTLAEAGFVVRDPRTLRYRLGWQLFTLAVSATQQHLTSLAPHLLRQLVANVGECAHLSVLDGGAVLTVLSESPPRTEQAIQAEEWVGRVAPVHCTSAGGALLLDHTEAQTRALLAGQPDPDAKLAALLDRVRLARRRGYATVNEDFEPGLVAVAAPVRDYRGEIVGALNISAPKFRLGRALAAAGREVKAAADGLSRALAAHATNRRIS